MIVLQVGHARILLDCRPGPYQGRRAEVRTFHESAPISR
jgi:hypothetical protein